MSSTGKGKGILLVDGGNPKNQQRKEVEGKNRRIGGGPQKETSRQ